MRSQVYLYILFTLVIITHFIRLLQNTQTLSNYGQFSTTSVVRAGGSCWFQQMPVRFMVPTCEQYPVGTVLHLTLVPKDSPSRDKGLFLWSGILPVSTKVVEVNILQPKPISWLWWASLATVHAAIWRERIVAPFNQLEPDHTALARKLFLGSGEKLAPELEDSVTRLGLQHVFAVSGSHVSMFLVFLVYLAGPFSRGLRFPLTVAVCMLIVVLAGPAGSVTRAVVMALVSGWVRTRGRRVDPKRLLVWTLFTTLGLNFNWLWDIGWQLSFLAMFAILWVIPLVNGLFHLIRVSVIGYIFRKRGENNYLEVSPVTKKPPGLGWWALKESGNALYLSIVVQGVMLPVLWWHFETISFAGIVVMFFGWWIFPLVFSSLLFGLLLSQTQIIGLIDQSLYSLYSTILYQIPLNLLTELMHLDQRLSILSINAELLPTVFICVYCLVLGTVLVVADRVGSGRTKQPTSTGYSPLLTALHGAYY